MKEVKVMKKRIFAILTLCTLVLSGCGANMKDGANIDGLGGAPNYGFLGDYNYSADAELKEEADGGAAGAPSDGGVDVGDDVAPLPEIIENKFINTSSEPVSTFSSDVDTASYAYFRKLVNMGYKLSQLKNTGKYAIRTEEFVNYFNYSYNEPKDGELFGITASASVCPWNKDNVLLTVGLKADDAVEKTKNNLVFLIDVSGSMNSEDKLQLLQKSFTHLVKKLSEDDTVSIVTYAGSEKVVLDGAKGNEHSKILSAINNLESGGSTNGESGLKTAYQIAEKYMSNDANNRIIMASDGDLNVGISSSDELKAFVEQKRDLGVYLSVLGFGTGNYKDRNMEAIADNGNGVYYYIDGETEAEKVFGEKLFSTLYTVAKDVKLQLTFNPDNVSKYRLVGYENRLLNKEDFEDDTKDAGELGAGHTLTVCYELVLTDSAKTSDGEWMTLAVRHKKPTETMSNLNEYQLDKSIYTDTPSDDFKFIGAVIETTMLLRESKYIGSVTFEDVQKTLNELTLTNSPDRYEFRELINKLTD